MTSAILMRPAPKRLYSGDGQSTRASIRATSRRIVFNAAVGFGGGTLVDAALNTEIAQVIGQNMAGKGALIILASLAFAGMGYAANRIGNAAEALDMKENLRTSFIRCLLGAAIGMGVAHGAEESRVSAPTLKTQTVLCIK